MKAPKRCHQKGCKKKLTLVQKTVACRCKHHYCTEHRFETDHSCTFNFKTFSKNILTKQLLDNKIINSCMEKI